MGNTAMVDIAFAMSTDTRVAILASGVYRLAATSGGSRGQVCPLTGATNLSQLVADRDRQSVTARELEPGHFRTNVPTNASPSKSRTGYCATSGAG